jgi:alpha-tubulin suppressor-like RCC1 family protein
VFLLFGTNGTKKDVILKNKAEKLLITQNRPTKTNPNKPKNKAEKSFRTAPVEKTNPKQTENKAGHVVENTQEQKSGSGYNVEDYFCEKG